MNAEAILPNNRVMQQAIGQRPRTSLIRRITGGGPKDSRLRRYILSALIAGAAAWALSLAYLLLTPPTFTSTFVLILPGTGAGSSINLEHVGQATTTSSAAFASPDLSPTENYRKMLLSDRMMRSAADLLGEPVERLPLPKVELSDQTKLISIKMTGRTPAQALARAEAARKAFLGMLDSLRADEIQTRDEAYRNNLVGYKINLNEARQQLIAHEASTGLTSVDQYSTIVAGVERLRDQARDVDAKVANMEAGVAELTRQLGVSADMATAAMILRGDPLFQALLEGLAKADAELATLTGTRGQNNPRVMDLTAERSNTAARLTARAAELTGAKRLDVIKLRDLSLHDERARLFERLIGQIADTAALRAMHARLVAQIADEQVRVASLAQAAAHNDDLKRDVQVAEAVFSSALARINTSKADFYASYPMVQTLDAPDLPHRPSTPLPILAVAGGLGATLLIILALVLTWLRIALLQRILKNA